MLRHPLRQMAGRLRIGSHRVRRPAVRRAGISRPGRLRTVGIALRTRLNIGAGAARLRPLLTRWLAALRARLRLWSGLRSGLRRRRSARRSMSCRPAVLAPPSKSAGQGKRRERQEQSHGCSSRCTAGDARLGLWSPHGLWLSWSFSCPFVPGGVVLRQTPSRPAGGRSHFQGLVVVLV
jgi:hypothetical protein